MACCALVAPACGRAAPRESMPAADTHDGRARRPRVVCLGDSLTAGHGLDAATQSYPALLQEKLDAARYEYEVVNAGVSGDTSAGGLERLEWSLAEGDVRVLVVALGANDGLRGLPVAALRNNLRTIVERGQARGLRVLLAGMELPSNLGADYRAAFRQAFREVARERRVPLLPFLLAGVAGDPALNLGDGIHPNAAGTRRVAESVFAALRPLLDADARARDEPAAEQVAGGRGR